MFIYILKWDIFTVTAIKIIYVKKAMKKYVYFENNIFFGLLYIRVVK